MENMQGVECRKVKMATQPKEPTQVNVKHISTGDLQTLKKKDSFSYYSIPGVRRAKLLQRDIDMSNLGTSDMSRSCTSCPSRLQTSRANVSQSVARRSRISFECHPDLLEEDEDEISDSDAESDDEDDPLDALLASMCVKSS